MSNLNQAQLIGRIGKDPEVRTLDGGNQVCNFSLATSEKWTDKSSGEVKEKTEWHNIVAWGKQVDVIQKYAFKGQLVFIQGPLQTRSWEKDGVTRYTTEVNCRVFQMLSYRDKDAAVPAAAPAPDPNKTFAGAPSQAATAAKSDTEEVDDLPF